MADAIVYLDYHLVLGDVVAQLEARGFLTKGLSPRALSFDAFRQTCSLMAPRFVFSVNFAPPVAAVAGLMGVPYVSWTIDPLPPSRLQLLEWTKPELCQTFAHRHGTVAALRQLGLASEYLPLAAPQERRAPIRSRDELAPYRSEISFVGASMVSEVRDFEAFCLRSGAQERTVARALEWARAVVQERGAERGFHGVSDDGRELPEWWRADLDPQVSVLEVVDRINGVLSAFHRHECVRCLDQAQIPLQVWGDAGWAGVAQDYRGVADHGRELTCVYNASSVNLDVPRLYQRDIITMRVFDVLAAGAFLLTERNAALDGLLGEGQHLAAYPHLDGLVDAVRDWGERPEERRAIADAGRCAVLDAHCMEHRVDQILQVVEQRGF